MSNNPNYINTITIYRKMGAEWKREVLQRCSWVCVVAASISTTSQTGANTYTVRIPAEAVNEGFAVNPGDIVVLGDCPRVIDTAAGNRAVEVLRAYKPHSFEVKTFSDNTRHLLNKHYRIGG